MVKVLSDARQLLRCGGFPYSLALLLRLAFTLMPANTGYIHPDEHFQSVEVVVGDVLGFSTLQTWEWDPDNPLRSPTLPLLLYGHHCTNLLLESWSFCILDMNTLA